VRDEVLLLRSKPVLRRSSPLRGLRELKGALSNYGLEALAIIGHKQRLPRSAPSLLPGTTRQ